MIGIPIRIPKRNGGMGAGPSKCIFGNFVFLRYRKADMDAQHGISGNWLQRLEETLQSRRTLSIGLIDGSVRPCGRASLDALMQHIVRPTGHRRRACLLVRTRIFATNNVGRQDDQPPGTPRPHPSPLGRWEEVETPLPVGSTTSWTEQQFPRWLREWQDRFQMVIVHLGPIHLAASRRLGCCVDESFLLLGPDRSGGPEWLQDQLARHTAGGSAICGSILLRPAA